MTAVMTKLPRNLLIVVVLLSSWVSGCGAASVGHYALQESATAERFAVLRPGARLYVAPDLTAPSTADEAAQPSEQPTRWRWLGRRGNWHALESVGPGSGSGSSSGSGSGSGSGPGSGSGSGSGFTRPRHCTSPPRALSGLQLQLWVQTADLVPVTAQRLTHRFADGTAVLLPAGQPVGDTVQAPSKGAGMPQLRPIALPGLLTAVPLADTALDLTYTPQPLPDPATAATLHLRNESAAVLGGGPLTRVGRYSLLMVQDVAPTGPDSVLATVQSGCGQVAVQTATTAVEPLGALLIGSMGGTSLPTGGWVRSDAPLYWPDGRPAGSSRSRSALGPVVPGPVDLRCHLLQVLDRPFSRKNAGSSQVPALPVCVRPADWSAAKPAD